MPIETERLILRELTPDDYGALCDILRDPRTMYAYNGAFTAEEVRGWLDRQLARYERDGFGLNAVVLRERERVIGQCGLTWQPWRDRTVPEVGYLFNRAYWHHGYASEAAIACRDYAFRVIGAEAVYSIVRETNSASRRVAERNGMTVVDVWTKRFRGAEMPHVLYRVDNPESRLSPRM